jgi:predicted transcriptional regulator
MRAELNKRRKKVMTMTDFNTKMTYVNAINYAIRFMQGEDMTEEQKFAVADKLVTLGEQLQKRNASKSGKPTKKQAENGNVKAQILQVLTDEGQKCGEIAEKVGISGQKCSALLTQLVNTEQVEKYTEKRVTYFRIPQ